MIHQNFWKRTVWVQRKGDSDSQPGGFEFQVSSQNQILSGYGCDIAVSRFHSEYFGSLSNTIYSQVLGFFAQFSKNQAQKNFDLRIIKNIKINKNNWAIYCAINIAINNNKQ